MRILAIGAHPDDVEFGCGGILLNEVARGADVFICVCSRGESGTNGTPEERELEARHAARLLRAHLKFLDFGGDAHIERSNKNALELAREIRSVQPDILLSSVTSCDQHPDHAVVGVLCRDAARLARYGNVAELRQLSPHAVAQHLRYAVTPGAERQQADCVIRVDISGQYQNWIALMECHATQVRTRSYVEMQIARARLLGQEAGVAYAQALFLRDDLLVDSLGEIPRSVRLF